MVFELSVGTGVVAVADAAVVDAVVDSVVLPAPYLSTVHAPNSSHWQHRNSSKPSPGSLHLVQEKLLPPNFGMSIPFLCVSASCAASC